jgi:hypothetical protein
MDPLRITTWLRDTQGQVAGDEVRLLVADVQA